MEADSDIIKSRFRNEASSLFAYIFQHFQQSVRKLDRQRDENVFRQLAGTHAGQLKSQLDGIAKKLMSQYKGSIDRLNRDLSKEIDYYLSEFNIKIMSM